jgi:6-pyruvoyl-tetrahydropterin synthase
MAPIPHRNDLIYYSTKTWEHVVSAAFRQPLAKSHCRHTHGYGLTVKATFGAFELDPNNWVVDFGALKSFKEKMEEQFDHKLLVCNDDPAKHALQAHQAEFGDMNIRIVWAVGCEAFSRLLFEMLEEWLDVHQYTPRVWVEQVEVSEHSGNSAITASRVGRSL